MINLPINEEFIFVNQNYKNKEEYFKKMCQILSEKGMVKNGYYESITSREEEYPTGLNIAGTAAIAIPHTEYQFANTTQIIITTLKNKLPFRRMDDPSQKEEISLIVQLLFDQPGKQPQLLKQLMSIIANPQLLGEILKAKSAAEIEKIFRIN